MTKDMLSKHWDIMCSDRNERWDFIKSIQRLCEVNAQKPSTKKIFRDLMKLVE